LRNGGRGKVGGGGARERERERELENVGRANGKFEKHFFVCAHHTNAPARACVTSLVWCVAAGCRLRGRGQWDAAGADYVVGCAPPELLKGGEHFLLLLLVPSCLPSSCTERRPAGAMPPKKYNERERKLKKKEVDSAYRAKMRMGKQQQLLSSTSEHGGSTAALPPAAAAKAVGSGCEVVDGAGSCLCENKRRKQEPDAADSVVKRGGKQRLSEEGDEAMRRQMRDDRVRVMDMLMLNLMR
jgi:hypothetical protein